MTTNGSQHPALALYDAGFTDLVSIIPPESPTRASSKIQRASLGKIPGLRGRSGYWHLYRWRDHKPTRAEIEQWVESGASFGLQTTHVPTLDCDIMDAGLSQDVEEAICPVLEREGTVLLRVGKRPKFAIPCRTDAPIRKIVWEFRDPKADQKAGGAAKGKVELLGDGQQFVVHGLHPSAGTDYWWRTARTADSTALPASDSAQSAALLANVGPDALPLLTSELISRIAATLQETAAMRGLTLHRSGTGDTRAGTSDVSPEELLAPDVATLGALVAQIPNSMDSRDDYVAFARAIRAATDPAHLADGLSIFLEWASRWEGGADDPEGNITVWEGLTQSPRIGWGYLLKVAHAHGINTSHLLGFDSEPVVARDETVVPGKSKDERFAALTRDADRTLLLCQDDLRGAAFRERRALLRTAVEQGDPLGAYFADHILPRAERLERYAPREAHFSLRLRSEMSSSNIRDVREAWATFTPDEQALLIEAARRSLLKPEHIAAGFNSGPRPPLSRRARNGDRDVLSGWLSRGSVGSLVGASGSGKSFIIVELAARVGTPAPASMDELEMRGHERFANKELPRGTVLVFAAEDGVGLRHRLSVIEDGRGIALASRVLIFDNAPPLASMTTALDHALAIMDFIPPHTDIPLVIFDTFRAAYSGKENDADEMSLAMLTASLIGRLFDAAVLLVHHEGKARSQVGMPRGSTVFFAALDFCASIKSLGTADARRFQMRVTKVKQGPTEGVFEWTLGKKGGLEDATVSVSLPQSTREQTAEERDATTIAGILIVNAPNPSNAISRRTLYEKMDVADPVRFGSDSLANPSSAKKRALQKAEELGFARCVHKTHKGKADPYYYAPPPTLEPDDALDSIT